MLSSCRLQFILLNSVHAYTRSVFVYPDLLEVRPVSKSKNVWYCFYSAIDSVIENVHTLFPTTSLTDLNLSYACA